MIFVLCQLPFEVAPQDIAAALSSEQEAITPIPGSIRPVYSKHRIEVNRRLSPQYQGLSALSTVNTGLK